MADTEFDELKTEIEFLYNLHLEEELSEWESNFIENVYKNFELGRSLSPATVAKLEELYDDHTGE